MILSNVEQDIASYDCLGVHYNVVADAIYKMRHEVHDPFSEEYLPFIVAGLIAFDMGRMMGKGARQKYCPGEKGFAFRLLQKMQTVRTLVGNLHSELSGINLSEAAKPICKAYNCLAESGPSGLNSDPSEHFHVGATKILHWLNPRTFVMVDQNVARAFKVHHQVDFKTGTQPGYTAEKYVE